MSDDSAAQPVYFIAHITVDDAVGASSDGVVELA